MKATTVSLKQLAEGTVAFTALEEAFGESSLGILVVNDLPTRYLELREKLLSYASYLAQLPQQDLDALTDAASHYEVGWSHGKEALKDGQYDTMKGSYYVDCQSFFLENPIVPLPGKTATRGSGTNLWPPESAIPGFRATFEELCTMLIDIGALVARAIDLYASKHIPQYRQGYLEHVVKTSHTPKARLLHYFPPAEAASATSSPSDRSADPSDSEEDSWCATHLDDGCLTALTSALYMDESSPLPPLTTHSFPSLPILPASPDPKAGLYIRSRGNKVVKVDIPTNCIAFQTGEALQMITDGKFKAVPHFVRGPSGASKVARNTLALFMQPDLDEVIDKEKGTTYGEFVDMIVQRHS
ncbi:Clavaminate synthase-like protein [Fonsecaea pedrosoi]|nr:Clavaminate synthase-like protein [Fonsecaea pedrosoi]